MKKVGYFCTLTPKEIIKAAGFTPVRILSSDDSISLANAHIQSYCCSQVRGSLERLLKGELDVEAAVFTRSCDSLMRLADIWERNSNMPVYNIEFPTRIDDKSKRYFIKELFDFKTKLEEWSGKEITFEDLETSIKLYSQLEKLLDNIFNIKPDYELILKTEVEDPEIVIPEANRKLKEYRNLRSNGKKVLVTGSVCPFIDIYRLIEEAGFFIVDDLCSGTRFFKSEVKERELKNMNDAIEFLADKYFLKAPCPTKDYENDRRIKYILKRAEEVDAVIFLLLKFCEPHFFDYPQLKKELESMGKKTLLLEIEFPLASREQLRTRLEAFYEMVMVE
jgi:benzoyl-CoA reductase/2-hydroxyglutaryl-CoA dehydratase subunit BcrC/BadD/HgdB